MKSCQFRNCDWLAGLTAVSFTLSKNKRSEGNAVTRRTFQSVERRCRENESVSQRAARFAFRLVFAASPFVSSFSTDWKAELAAQATRNQTSENLYVHSRVHARVLNAKD